MLAEKNWILETPIDVEQEWQRIERLYFDQYIEGKFTLIEHRRERMREFLKHVNVARSDAELIGLFEEYLFHYSQSWIAYPDVEGALSELRRRDIPLGILTNGQQLQQEAKLKQMGFSDTFETVLAIGTISQTKPHPQAFLELCAALGFQPKEVLYVGDDPYVDVLAAKNAGLESVWLNRTELPAPEGITHQISSLNDLIEFIDELPH